MEFIIKKLNIKSKSGRFYLLIGSSVIIDNTNNTSLIFSPTMLLPQNISDTDGAYYSTQAILYDILINRKDDIDDINIIFTSLCRGYGKMDEINSVKQIINGIRYYE
jgi:hypothetical protein